MGNPTPLQYKIADLARRAKNRCPMSGWPEETSPYDDIVAAWFAGMRGETPACLRKFEQDANKELDPEFVQYSRLRRKFG